MPRWPELWKIDASDNEVCLSPVDYNQLISLDGIGNRSVLGALLLAGNNLSLSSLKPLRFAFFDIIFRSSHIVELTLLENPRIVSLKNCWAESIS